MLSFQSAEVQTTDKRSWLRLVGQRHDLQRWVADDRRPPANFWAQYRSVSPVLYRGLSWVSDVLEPVRMAHFADLQLFAPSAELSLTSFLSNDVSSLRVALLEGKSNDDAGVEKEVIVMREPPVVHIFNVIEHGRRWYRSLVFSSDASCSLAALEAHVALHAGAPTLVCGDALTPVAPAPSIVVTRAVPGTGGGEQTFLPTKLLQGLLPAALLDLYHFWQNDVDDSIDGYPSNNTNKGMSIRL